MDLVGFKITKMEDSCSQAQIMPFQTLAVVMQSIKTGPLNTLEPHLRANHRVRTNNLRCEVQRLQVVSNSLVLRLDEALFPVFFSSRPTGYVPAAVQWSFVLLLLRGSCR